MAELESLQVEDGGRTIAFTFDDMMRYHGPHSPAGVAMAFKVSSERLVRSPRDAPPARRSIVVRTAFGVPVHVTGSKPSPGASPAAATRSTDPWCGRTGADCSRTSVFEVTIGDRAATLLLRDGFVTDEFIDLARTETRSAEQEKPT